MFFLYLHLVSLKIQTVRTVKMDEDVEQLMLRRAVRRGGGGHPVMRYVRCLSNSG